MSRRSNLPTINDIRRRRDKGLITQDQFDTWVRQHPADGSMFGGFVGDFIDDTVDSVNKTIDDPFGYTKENVESGLETLENIGSDINTYTRQFAKDTGQHVLDNIKDATDLGTLFDDPLKYFRNYNQNLFGDGYTPGYFDKYGAWLNLVPGGQGAYLIGQGINMANDYHYTGDEDALRQGAQNMGAAYAGGQVGQAVGGYLPDGYPSNIGAGATTGGTSSFLRGDDKKDIVRNAGVGGAQGAVGTFLGGTPMKDDATGQIETDINGRPIFSNDLSGSLNLGQEAYTFGTSAVGFGDSIVRRKEAQSEYEQKLADILNRYNQQLNNEDNIGTNAPEIEAVVAGSPFADLFAAPEDKEAARKKVGMGSNQLGPTNTQVTTPQDYTAMYQGGTYQL